MGSESHRPRQKAPTQSSPRRKNSFQKRTARLLRHIPKGFTVVSEDESIFVQNIETKKVWAARGIRPVRIVSGSHGNTVVFGAISLDGRQFFRQYHVFNGETFLDYLKQVHRHYGKLYLLMDKAKQHYDTNIVTEYLRKNRKTLRVRWIPTASPEFNMLEECWREGEKDLARLSIFPTTLEELQSILAKYYRTRRFSSHLDMKKFLLINRCL